MSDYTAARIEMLKELYQGRVQFCVAGHGKRFERICKMVAGVPSAFEFVEIATGAVYSAASWNKRGACVQFGVK